MNYEERLKNHLELAKEWYNDPTTTARGKERLEAMFPELKEAEEEKIRKAIKYGLDHVFTNNTTIYEVGKEQCLAWLEEKAGQKGNKGNEKKIPNSEQKLHEWSEIEDIAVHLENLGNTAMANTLRSFRPQANHEWSEEDEAKLNFLTNVIKLNLPNHSFAYGQGAAGGYKSKWDIIEMLKSIVRRKSCWKPSTAQMGALSLACDGKLLSLDYLNSLYNDLKKL